METRENNLNITLLAFVILTVISGSCAILAIIFGDPLWLTIGTGVFLIKTVGYEVCTKGAGIRRLKQVFGRLKL